MTQQSVSSRSRSNFSVTGFMTRRRCMAAALFYTDPCFSFVCPLRFVKQLPTWYRKSPVSFLSSCWPPATQAILCCITRYFIIAFTRNCTVRSLVLHFVTRCFFFLSLSLHVVVFQSTALTRTWSNTRFSATGSSVLISVLISPSILRSSSSVTRNPSVTRDVGVLILYV